MFPKIIDGKVFVPIVPSSTKDGVMLDGMREVSPDDPEYESIKAAIESDEPLF